MTTYRNHTAVPGEFVPGTGFMYTLDPRTKLFASLLYVWVVLTTDSYVVLAGCTVVAVMLIPFCRVTVLHLFKALKSILWLSVILAAMLLVMHRMRGTGFGPDRLLPFARILLTAAVSMLFTRTTAPADLIESLRPRHLSRFSHRMAKGAFIMLIVLQFAPFLFRELFRLRMLHALRGAVRPGIRRKFTGFFTVLIPLFTLALRKADLLADALVARGYGFDIERTVLHHNGFRAGDAVAAVTVAALFVGAHAL